jgi:uncharacterized protein (TIGR02996 family)
MPARKPTAADSTLATLYKAVLANPDDDLPRLVYADRLDELGDHPRAEFIRAQIHVANTNPWDEGHADALVKSKVLLDRHEEAWGIKELTRDLMRSKGVTPGVFNPFVRGFPEITWANVETFSAAHRKALKKYPIRELVLVGGERRGGAVEIINEIRPRTVEFLGSGWLVFAELSDGQPLPSVRCMKFDDIPSYDRIRSIAGRGPFAFPNVEELHVAGMSDESRLSRCLALIRELRWPKLLALYLHGEFTPRVQAALADAGWVGQLDTLSLEHSPSGDVDLADQPAGELTPLFRSARTTALRSLSLDSFPWPPSVEQAFATSTLGPLDHFEIDGWCDPPVSDYRALLASPALAGVKSLALPGPDTSPTVVEQLGRNGELRQLKWGTWELTPAAWAVLADSPAALSLRRLHLERADVSEAVVKVLLAGPSWPNLAELACEYGKHDGRAVAKLIDHPHFARLTHLNVREGTRAADLWKALAKSKTVGRFHKLRLGFPIGDKQLNALLDNPEVCKIGRLALPARVKVSAKTQRRYEKVFGVRITRDW